MNLKQHLKNYTLEEFVLAKRELELAEINFNNAEPEYFESANAMLTAAREKMNALFK